MPQVDYLPFATAPGANVLDQPSWAALPDRQSGFIAGIARSLLLNKAWRQSSVMSASLANFIAGQTGLDVLDDGNVPALTLLFEQALAFYLENNPALGVRQRLTADATYFVAPGGSDATGDGSSPNPWQSVQHAVDWVLGEIDFGGANHAFIQLADGTYNASTVVGAAAVGSVSPGQLVIRGNAANNSAVTLNVTGDTGLWADNGASVLVRDLRVIATGGNGLAAGYGGQLLFENINFGASQSHLYAIGGGSVMALDDYTISGGASFGHVRCDLGGYVELSGTSRPINATLIGTPAFAGGFVYCAGGQVYADSNTYTGAATGPRYALLLNGVIYTGQPTNLNYFPGSAPGTIATGGQYG